MPLREDTPYDGWATPSARILCQRTDGLGCRLLTLLWTMRLARTVNAGVLMFWPSLNLFGYQGSVAGDIFDLLQLASPPMQSRLQIIDGESRSHLRHWPVELDRETRHEPGHFTVPLDANLRRGKWPMVVGSWEGPLLAPGERRKAVLAEMPSLFAELPFRRDLLREANRIARQSRLSEAVAVYVRRGEIIQNLRTAVSAFRLDEARTGDRLDDRVGTFVRRCVPIEDLARALRDFVDQGRRIVVFSDEPTACEALSEALGTSELLAAASLIETTLSPIQQAFVETVLIGKCRCLVGARSAYSEFGHIVGGNARVLLTTKRRPPADTSAFLLESVADELAAHPERTHVERRVHDHIVRLRG